jgi:hypothetical protein
MLAYFTLCHFMVLQKKSRDTLWEENRGFFVILWFFALPTYGCSYNPAPA